MRAQLRLLSCLALVAALAAAFVVSGCGSDDSSSSTSSSKAGGATKDPIKLWTISFVDSPFGSVPGPFAGAKAAARAINKAGGVNGHPIEVTTCNSHFTPADELACARNAVKDGATAMVGSLAFANSPANLAIWKRGNLANVGGLPTVPQDFVSPINFPINSFLSTIACVTAFPKAVKATKIGFPVLDLAISKATFGLDQKAAAKSGVQTVDVTVPATATDLSTYVQQLSNKGADAITIGLDPAKSPQFIKAAADVGKTWPYCHSDGVVTGGQLVQLGDTASNYYAGSTVPPLTAVDQYPMLQKFIDDMAAEKASGDDQADTSVDKYASNMLIAWLSVQTVKQVAEKIDGPIDHDTFMDAIKTSKVDLGGIVPDIDFAKENPTPGFNRMFNPRVVLLKWDSAKKGFYLVKGQQPVDAVAAIAG
jgi:branched-chain amino acid transport system substrate-binding protein